MALSSRETPRPSIGPARARQGRSGRHVLWVLVFGVLLVVLGFIAAYAWKADDLASSNANNGPSVEDARQFNAPEPAPINSAVNGNDAPDNLAPAGAQPSSPAPRP